jgi:hypothetical protein
MGHYTSHRKSSFHWTAEAYLAFGIGLARRVSHAERRASYAERCSSYAERRSSHAERRPSRSKSRRTSNSAPSSSPYKPKRASSPLPHRSKPAKSHPCYHRIVTPEPTYYHQNRDRSYSLHEFCVASDATYARLAARWDGSGEAFLVGGRWATFL